MPALEQPSQVNLVAQFFSWQSTNFPTAPYPPAVNFRSTRAAANGDYSRRPSRETVTAATVNDGLLGPAAGDLNKNHFSRDNLDKIVGFVQEQGLDDQARDQLLIRLAGAHALRAFLPAEAVDDPKMAEIIDQALNFGMPIEVLKELATGQLQDIVVRLDQGDTGSFKDIAARILARLTEIECEKSGQKKNIIVATSGDTGGAIAEAFADSQWVTVTVLYPANVSEIQEKQMVDVAAKHSNVQCLKVEDANFDECQAMAKTLFGLAEAFKNQASGTLDAKKYLEKISFYRGEIKTVLGEDLEEEAVKALAEKAADQDAMSANSINFWRAGSQETQFIASILRLIDRGQLTQDQQVAPVIPSGNLGHMVAAVYAKLQGAPIQKIIIGTNQNKIFAEFVKHGLIRHDGFQETFAPAMDILDPSNLERLLDLVAEVVGEPHSVDFPKFKAAIKSLDPKSKRDEILNTHFPQLVGDDRKKQGEALEAFMQQEASNESIAAELTARLGAKSEVIADEIKRFYQAAREGIEVKEFGVSQNILGYLQDLIFVTNVDSDQEMIDIAQNTYEDTGVVLEGHGTCGKKALDQARADQAISEDTVAMLMETAHLAKFEEFSAATGIEPAAPHPKLAPLKSQTLPEIGEVVTIRKQVLALLDKVESLRLAA